MLRGAAAAGSEPGADRRRALGRGVERLDELRALALKLDPRPLAGQGAGNDRAVGREPMPMRIERDDRNLFERLSHGARAIRNSRAPAPPRIGEGMRPSTVQPCASIVARTPSHARSSAASLLTRPLTRSAAAELELRLDEADEPRPLARELQHMRQHEPLRNEAHVDDDRVRRFAEHLRRERARVEAFERADARVGREARIELSVADIDGDDLRRAAREQDVGEASGRGADVEADEARRIEREGVERGGELDPAARRPGVGRLGFDRRVARDLFRGLLERDAADADEPGRDRGLRARAARKEAALDENDIRTLAHGAFNEPREAHCQ